MKCENKGWFFTKHAIPTFGSQNRHWLLQFLTFEMAFVHMQVLHFGMKVSTIPTLSNNCQNI
jgi:hypothetical protein